MSLTLGGRVAYIPRLRPATEYGTTRNVPRPARRAPGESALATYHATRLEIDPTAYVAPGAALVGEVTLGRHASVSAAALREQRPYRATRRRVRATGSPPPPLRRG